MRKRFVAQSNHTFNNVYFYEQPIEITQISLNIYTVNGYGERFNGRKGLLKYKLPGKKDKTFFQALKITGVGGL